MRLATRLCALVSCSVILTCLSVGAQVTEPPAQSTVIADVTVVDVATGKLKPGMTVVISANRITDVGPSAQVSIPKSARVVDAKGKFLIPGLWDMHVHLGNATEGALPALIAAGVTGVRDMGTADLEALRRWRVEALSGVRVGPRIVAAGPILDGGAPDPTRIIVRTKSEAQKAVDLLAVRGADFIKVHEHLERDVYFVILDRATLLGLPVAGHVPAGDVEFIVSGVEAANAGQKSLEHLFGIPFQVNKIDAALTAALLRNGTRVTPTLTVFWTRAHFRESAVASDPRHEYAAPELRRFWEQQSREWSVNAPLPKKLLQWRMSGVKALHDAGVPLLAGTDLGFPFVPPGAVADELRLLVEAGLTPDHALRRSSRPP